MTKTHVHGAPSYRTRVYFICLRCPSGIAIDSDVVVDLKAGGVQKMFKAFTPKESNPLEFLLTEAVGLEESFDDPDGKNVRKCNQSGC